MRFGCLRRARSRSGRTMVGGRPRDWSRRFAASLGLESIEGQRIDIGLESAAVAASWFLAGCGAPDGNWHYACALLDAYRTAEILGACGFILSLCAVLQNPGPLEKLCLVFIEPRVCGFLVCYPAEFYVQRKIVLGAGTAVRW